MRKYLIIKSSHQGIEHNPIITILPIHKQNFLKFEIARVWLVIMFVGFKEISRKTLRNPLENRDVRTKYNTSLDIVIVSYI